MKKILVFFLCFNSIFFPGTIWADWFCPTNLESYSTLNECQAICGNACIETGIYMCAADTDGDGENELYQCQQVSVCPFGDYPCENGQCSVSGTCTAQQQGECKITVGENCGATGCSIIDGSCSTSPGGTCCFDLWGALWGVQTCYRFDNNCNVTDIWDSISNTWLSFYLPNGGEYCWDVGDYYTWIVCRLNESTFITEYSCSLNGEVYSSLSECQSACIQTATCTSSWQCPVAGGSDCALMSDASSYTSEPVDLTYETPTSFDTSTGECSGQIYIFNGRPMMCRKSGVETGFHNCCDADDDIKQEINNAITSVGTLQTIYKIKDAISLATEAYQAYQALVSGVSAIEVASNFDWSTTAINAAIDTFSSGGSATDAILSALQNGLAISPTSLLASVALSFAIDFAMKILFSGCNEEDVTTATYKELGLCHEIGEKCIKKYPIIGCVQKAKVFCCFNSKLARIVHEQGRSQLRTFGSWGSTDAPNCRGFTPEEFRMLDFSQMDLSEYVQDLQNRIPTQTDLENKALREIPSSITY